jgi:hypothetical protein
MRQQRTHTPRVGTALLCPVAGCTTTWSSTSLCLQPIRRLHQDCSFTKSQLRGIGAVYCPKCLNSKYVTGRGHRCLPTAPQMPQPPDPGSRQTESQTPEPASIPSPFTSLPARPQLYPAPKPLDGPAALVSQTAPYTAHEAWGRATATHIRAPRQSSGRNPMPYERQPTGCWLYLTGYLMPVAGALHSAPQLVSIGSTAASHWMMSRCRGSPQMNVLVRVYATAHCNTDKGGASIASYSLATSPVRLVFCKNRR